MERLERLVMEDSMIGRMGSRRELMGWQVMRWDGVVTRSGYSSDRTNGDEEWGRREAEWY